jgi:4-amino-4-deoxy-L-arabinose transferase-like glycosyltransferase
MNKHYFPTGIVVLFCALYLQQAWVPGFFHDGYLYAALGKNAWELGHWLVPHLNEYVYPEFTHHIPFTFILEGLFFGAFGSGYTQARIFGALWIAFTVLLMLWWGEKKGERTWAWWSSLLFILIPAVMKKSRFPSIDLVLIFFCFATLVMLERSLETKRFRDWLLAGIAFGGGLLAKGPIVVAVPIAFFLFLLTQKKTKTLICIKPWASLGLGLGLFSLWPLALYFADKSYIFTAWVGHTFKHTIVDGRGEPSSSLTYLKFLLIQCAPWLILVGVGLWKRFKKGEQNSSFDLHVIFALVLFLILSTASFKYSHYLLPLYPSLAIAAGFVLSRLSFSVWEKAQRIVMGLAIAAALVLLIFPITNKTTRDADIFSLLETIETLPASPTAWAIVDGAYPFFALNNLLSYHKKGLVLEASQSEAEGIALGTDAIPEVFKGRDWIFLVRPQTWETLRDHMPGWSALSEYTKSGFVAVIRDPLFRARPLLKQ